jgi:hypothetical protein
MEKQSKTFSLTHIRLKETEEYTFIIINANRFIVDNNDNLLIYDDNDELIISFASGYWREIRRIDKEYSSL